MGWQAHDNSGPSASKDIVSCLANEACLEWRPTGSEEGTHHDHPEMAADTGCPSGAVNPSTTSRVCTLVPVTATNPVGC